MTRIQRDAQHRTSHRTRHDTGRHRTSPDENMKPYKTSHLTPDAGPDEATPDYGGPLEGSPRPVLGPGWAAGIRSNRPGRAPNGGQAKAPATTWAVGARCCAALGRLGAWRWLLALRPGVRGALGVGDRPRVVLDQLDGRRRVLPPLTPSCAADEECEVHRGHDCLLHAATVCCSVRATVVACQREPARFVGTLSSFNRSARAAWV